MLILLDCRPLQYAGPGSEKNRLIFSAVAALAAEKAVKWLFVADHSYRPGDFPELPPGTVLIRRALPGRPGWKLWYDWQIPRLARQQGADAVMLTGGIAAAAPAIVPQWLWMPERADSAEGGDARRYPSIYRGRLAASLRRAAAVFCFSERDRALLAGLGPTAGDKIHVFTPFADEGVKPASPAEKEETKATRTQGREYFLADLSGGGQGVVVNLLRAFSLFKKRQHSNMRLVLTGRLSGPSAAVRELIKTYKYRQDVHWSEDPAFEGPELAGTAYAALFPFEGNSLGIALLNTWKAGVPVIAVDAGLLQEMAGGAALGVVAGDPASLAAQLMLIYKDEQLRRDLISKGFERLDAYSRERSLKVLWDGIGRELIKFADNKL
jgi:glycosyltransferase involved in cell wall biosynthesis